MKERFNWLVESIRIGDAKLRYKVKRGGGGREEGGGRREEGGGRREEGGGRREEGDVRGEG